MLVRSVPLVMLALTLLLSPAGAAPKPTSKPIPGGSNQASGITGKLGATMFNGKIRIRATSLRAGTSSDSVKATNPGEKVVYFSCIVSNGTHGTRIGYLSASLVDRDGIVLNSVGGPLESNYNLPPGGAARQTFGFILKPGFTPVKILVSELANGVQPVFRILLTPKEIPSK
ncbi:MAG: hypothetical protein ACYDA1_04575 [Vulcanimicrobiaceae bacterium]